MLHKTLPTVHDTAALKDKLGEGMETRNRDYTKLLVPIMVVGAVCVLVGISSTRWDEWQAGADVQTTNNAYIRADISRLSARVAGNISKVMVNDFQRVKAGQELVEIEQADYLAKQAQAAASLRYAVSQLANVSNQQKAQQASIRQADAQTAVAEANALLATQEVTRQQSLLTSGSTTAQKYDQAVSQVRTTAASLQSAQAAANSARAQLDVVDGQVDQLAANVASAKAALESADLSVSYTKILAPFDGVVSERQVQAGDYVTTGTNVITIVPLPDVYMIANFKETQIGRMKEGQSATVTVDALPGRAFKAHLSRLAPASGSQFALLPADNATGNFTKVVQRVPIRLDFDDRNALDDLVAGMSAVVSVSVSASGAGKE